MTPPLGNCRQTHSFENKIKHIILQLTQTSKKEEHSHKKTRWSSSTQRRKWSGPSIQMSLKVWHWHPRGGEMCSRCCRTVDWNRHSGLPSRVLLQQKKKFSLQQAPADPLLIQPTRLDSKFWSPSPTPKFFLQLNNDYHGLRFPMQPPNSPKQRRERRWEVWDRLGDLPDLYCKLAWWSKCMDTSVKNLDRVNHFELKSTYSLPLTLTPVQTVIIKFRLKSINVRGEPVFTSVMAAGWFCETSGWIGKVEDVKPVLLKTERISTGNHFEEEDFYADELWNMRISFGLIHLWSDIVWF